MMQERELATLVWYLDEIRVAPAMGGVQIRFDETRKWEYRQT